MSDTGSVLFVCLHGSAKSVIAAHYLERIAAERRIRLAGSSAGAEPDDTIPPHVVAGLQGDAFEPRLSTPRGVTREMVRDAAAVVSFGCDLTSMGGDVREVVRWDDVPAVSDGYAAARDEISRRVRRLVSDLEARHAQDGNPHASAAGENESRN